jgi:hypothetical protein
VEYYFPGAYNVNNIEEVSMMSVQPFEKQPQVITSADRKLQILNHAAGGDQFGCYSIKGAIRNISTESDLDIEILVDYYDIHGIKIDTEVDALYLPHPGGSRGFHIIYPGLRHDDVHSYKLYPSVKKPG